MRIFFLSLCLLKCSKFPDNKGRKTTKKKYRGIFFTFLSSFPLFLRGRGKHSRNGTCHPTKDRRGEGPTSRGRRRRCLRNGSLPISSSSLSRSPSPSCFWKRQRRRRDPENRCLALRLLLLLLGMEQMHKGSSRRRVPLKFFPLCCFTMKKSYLLTQYRRREQIFGRCWTFIM